MILGTKFIYWFIFICFSYHLNFLLQAIRRLSNGDLELLEHSCEFLNQAFTKEDEKAMMGKLEDFKQKQEKWNQSLQREGII